MANITKWSASPRSAFLLFLPVVRENLSIMIIVFLTNR
jgi:hypothetical protein